MTDIGGRYLMSEILGAGGMGEVFRATDVQTGETVAIKARHADLNDRDSDHAFYARGCDSGSPAETWDITQNGVVQGVATENSAMWLDREVNTEG